jgi:dihydropteroate synthase-like protein
MSRILFVTGKLAEPSLRRLLADFCPRAGVEYSVTVLPITVIALATTSWIARHLGSVGNIDRIIVPGLCGGDLEEISRKAGATTERGPKDLRELPEFFGEESRQASDYGAHDISILAEINHAARLSLDDLVRQARSLAADGADVIDLGCEPGQRWSNVGDAVRGLREHGLRVSIDSFDPHEVKAAVAAGAELVLSVNSTNCHHATSWGTEVVAIPDVPASLEGLDRTVDRLIKDGVHFRIDPIVEPIGFGFAASFGRYLEIRRRYPEVELMMGVGNITELTDVDSAGINVLLLGFCQELGIRSVLTTQVINWCRSCVRELDLARRLVYHACKHKVLPKHLEPSLVMLRDPKVYERGEAELVELAQRITDANFRIFAERGRIHVLNDRMVLQDEDPFVLFEEMSLRQEIDPSHAFYLGYEMAKAAIALALGKQYSQDEALRWGLLTKEERNHPPSGQAQDGS